MTKFTPLHNIILDAGLNDHQFHTYCLIMRQCWNPETGSFEWMEPISMPQLSRLFGKPRTTMIDHLKALQDQNVIEFHKISDIVFSLKPAESVGQPSKVTASRPITIIESSNIREGLIELKEEEEDGQPTPVGQPTLSVEITEFLRSKGVGEPTRSRIAASGKTLDYIQHWLKYIRLKCEPVGHAIAAIRDDLPKPEICSACDGVDGHHATVRDEERHILLCFRGDYVHLSDEEFAEQFGEMTPI